MATTSQGERRRRLLPGRFGRQGVEVGGDPLEQIHQHLVLVPRSAVRV
ncbi:hypothetical protein [Streptomyces abikoensis]